MKGGKVAGLCYFVIVRAFFAPAWDFPFVFCTIGIHVIIIYVQLSLENIGVNGLENILVLIQGASVPELDSKAFGRVEMDGCKYLEQNLLNCTFPTGKLGRSMPFRFSILEVGKSNNNNVEGSPWPNPHPHHAQSHIHWASFVFYSYMGIQLRSISSRRYEYGPCTSVRSEFPGLEN